MGKNKWIWITAGIMLLLIIGVGVALVMANGGGNDNPPSNPPGLPNNNAPNQNNPPTPGQVVKKYTCETKKVCQGREGYANWVKTGTQRKCKASNISQGFCISDCLGTCYTWE